MRFEWDEAKRVSNIEQHGTDFLRAREMFDGRPLLEAVSLRDDERRVLSIGALDGRIVAVVWTLREERAVRIISVRRARDAEESHYRQSFV